MPKNSREQPVSGYNPGSPARSSDDSDIFMIRTQSSYEFPGLAQHLQNLFPQYTE